MADRSILVVDDNEINRGILGEIFKDKYNILEAGDGVEALKMMEENEGKLAAVLLDIVMPEVGGIEALQVMKEVSPEVPVVMLSSAGSPQTLMTTLKMGAMEFIQKPYKSEQIKKVVETIRKKVGLDG